MRKIIILILSFTFVSYVHALPTSQKTAEGVAADLASAFINTDNELWEKIQLKKLQSKKQYKSFVEAISKQMISLKNKDNQSGPKEVIEIRKMGKLSKNGPNSYAYSVFNLTEIGYVDVCVINYDNKKSWNRTFVLKYEKEWFVLPRPDLFPLLTMGLNNEKEVKEIEYKK